MRMTVITSIVILVPNPTSCIGQLGPPHSTSNLRRSLDFLVAGHPPLFPLNPNWLYLYCVRMYSGFFLYVLIWILVLVFQTMEPPMLFPALEKRWDSV